MIGLWSAPAAVYPVDDLDYHVNAADRMQDDDRERKRQRRSIFFAQPDTDSDDGDDYADQHRAINQCRGGKDKAQSVPVRFSSAPYAADPLSKGAHLLSPSFPRRSSLPCLGRTDTFVAVHEEPNSGFRHYMEDRSAAMTVGGVAYFGIYDGHGGVDASTFLQQHLLPTIQAHLRPGCDVHDALTAAYMATNAAFRATGSIQGSTATTIILNNTHLIAANVGDSPAFVVKKSGEVCLVIKEHKIEGEEAARIAAQGVPIYRSPTGPAYMGTPDGTRWLNMSRAFGDFVYPAISCEPYICSLDVSDGKYLVMGSDGLTEKWPVADAAEWLVELANAGWSLPAICRSLVERSLARGSTDNISCMIVDLEAYMVHAEAAAPMATDQMLTATAAERNSEQQPTEMVSPPPPAPQQQPASNGKAGQHFRPQGGGADFASADGMERRLLCREEVGLLCNEDLSDRRQQPSNSCEAMTSSSEQTAGILCNGAGVIVSGAALASCAANALRAARGPDGCRRQETPNLAADQACIANAGPDKINQGGCAAPTLAEGCLLMNDAGASPACSSPDLCEERGGSTAAAAVAEGIRQATPQPVQTACRSLDDCGHEDLGCVVAGPWTEGVSEAIEGTNDVAE